jgi:hypothetical protein
VELATFDPAAKLLGVDESTVRADLRDNPAENAGKSRTPTDQKRAEIEAACKLDNVLVTKHNVRHKK